MSTHWIRVGRCKLRPDPRIARLNLLVMLALACLGLRLDGAGGRPIQGIATRGAPLQRDCRPLPRRPLQHPRMRSAGTDGEQSWAGAPGTQVELDA